MHRLPLKIFAPGFGGAAGDAFKTGPGKADPEGAASDQVRFFDQSPNAFQKHKQQMVSRDVVGTATLAKVAPLAVRLASRTVMDQLHIRKSARGPAQHVSFDFVHRVPSWGAEEPAKLLPACSTVNFGGSPNMEGGIDFRFHFQCAVDRAANRSSPDAKGWVRFETLKALFKIVAGKRQIPVELYQEIPGRNGVLESWSV